MSEQWERKISNGWQPIASAPKDGTVVQLHVDYAVQAYFDAKLDRWILVRPLHIESLSFFFPDQWRPK
jgi:hypothetical protein